MRWKRVIETIAATLGIAFVVTGIVAKVKRGNSVYENAPEQKNPLEGKKVVFIEDENEKANADGVRGHLEAVANSDCRPGLYEKYVKESNGYRTFFRWISGIVSSSSRIFNCD